MPEPAPAADEILVDVHAASVTYMDRLLVSGGYQMRPPTPFVPGTEAAGVVVVLGDKVTRFRIGDRVACLSWTGGMGERMAAKEWKAVRLPDGVSFEVGATILHSYDTAWSPPTEPSWRRARPWSTARAAAWAWPRSTSRCTWAAR